MSTVGNSGVECESVFQPRLAPKLRARTWGTEFVRVLSFHDDGILSGTTTYLVQAVALIHQALEAGFVDQVVG